MHKGFWFFTIGQQRGVGLSGGPWYFVAKDVPRNVFYVSRSYCNEEETQRELTFEDAVWIAGDWSAELSEVGASRRLDVKLRHRPRLVAATVTRTGAASGHLRLDERDKGIAAGQVVALYDGEMCVGSGMICSAVELGDAPEVIVPRKRGTSG